MALRVITPTLYVIDRLLAYHHWRDPQSWDQAILVCKNNPIDWDDIALWAKNEKPEFLEIEGLRAEAGLTS